MIHRISSSTSTSYVTLLQETRGGPWQEEVTAGCCSLQAAPDPDHAALLGPAKEPVLASCVRSFMSWMAEKAERGTSAFLESLPSLSKVVLCSAPSVPQPVVQSRRRPLLGPSPG